MDEKLDEARARLLKLSEVAEADGEPLRWFEELYAGAGRDSEEIPWAKMEANPKMIEWIAERSEITGRALVVGCGLGDDAEWLSAAGFDVTAFDLSQSSIDWCHERFPQSSVNYKLVHSTCLHIYLFHFPLQSIDNEIQIYLLSYSYCWLRDTLLLISWQFLLTLR